MNARDHRLIHARDRLDHDVHAVDQALELARALLGGTVRFARERADVASGHEVAAGTADHEHANRVVTGDRGGRRNQRVDHREVEDVERRGTVEGQRRDVAIAGEQDGGRVHGGGG